MRIKKINLIWQGLLLSALALGFASCEPSDTPCPNKKEADGDTSQGVAVMLEMEDVVTGETTRTALGENGYNFTPYEAGANGDVQVRGLGWRSKKPKRNDIDVGLTYYAKENVVLQGYSWRYADDYVGFFRDAKGERCDDYLQLFYVQGLNNIQQVRLPQPMTLFTCKYREGKENKVLVRVKYKRYDAKVRPFFPSPRGHVVMGPFFDGVELTDARMDGLINYARTLRTKLSSSSCRSPYKADLLNELNELDGYMKDWRSRIVSYDKYQTNFDFVYKKLSETYLSELKKGGEQKGALRRLYVQMGIANLPLFKGSGESGGLGRPLPSFPELESSELDLPVNACVRAMSWYIDQTLYCLPSIEEFYVGWKHCQNIDKKYSATFTDPSYPEHREFASYLRMYKDFFAPNVTNAGRLSRFSYFTYSIEARYAFEQIKKFQEEKALWAPGYWVYVSQNDPMTLWTNFLKGKGETI